LSFWVEGFCVKSTPPWKKCLKESSSVIHWRSRWVNSFQGKCRWFGIKKSIILVEGFLNGKNIPVIFLHRPYILLHFLNLQLYCIFQRNITLFTNRSTWGTFLCVPSYYFTVTTLSWAHGQELGLLSPVIITSD
jgi:hypothetical protein